MKIILTETVQLSASEAKAVDLVIETLGLIRHNANDRDLEMQAAELQDKLSKFNFDWLTEEN